MRHYMKTRQLICAGFPLLSLAVIIACNNPIKDKSTGKEDPSSSKQVEYATPKQKANANMTVQSTEDLVGFWVGWFEPEDKIETVASDENPEPWDHVNKITISIDSIGNGVVVGHSIVAGNFRPFRGTYREDPYGYKFDTSEPGDNEYDGTFSFSIFKLDSLIKGNWTAYKDIEVKKRKYSLAKKTFVYNPAVKMESSYIDWTKSRKGQTYYEEDSQVYYNYSYFTNTEAIFDLNPSTQALNVRQVEKLSKADVFILRNSIYAKHGYSFRNRQLRAYFDDQSWYMPVHVDIRKDLTQLELDNIKLLMRYEKHAEEYYDEFGR